MLESLRHRVSLFRMHHANLLIGSRAWGLSHLALDAQGENAADLMVFDEPTLSIAAVRMIGEAALRRPVVADHRTFVLAYDVLLPEAQNALLKLFEEPNPATLFYLIVPREDALLPTLRSRLHLLDREPVSLDGTVFTTFRRASYADRIAIIGEKVAAEDTEWIRALLRGTEQHASKERDSVLMETVLFIESYLEGSGSSKKMLLEHLALSF